LNPERIAVPLGSYAGFRARFPRHDSASCSEYFQTHAPDCAGESSRRKGIKIDPKGEEAVFFRYKVNPPSDFSIAFGQADRQAPIRIARLRKLVPKKY